MQDFSDWFIETFSMQDVVKAAKKRLNSTWGQTDLLDTHFDQLRRDVARIGGSLTDGSQVDNIMESVSPQCVDELSKLGYMGLGTLAKNHSENPVNRHQFDTGIHTIEWFQQHEPAYISAAQDAGASQYWVGYKGRKLQSHPKRATKDPKGIGINFVEEETRMKQIEQRQDRLESQITEVKQTQDDTKQEVTTLSSKVMSWQESSDKKQDEMLQMLRKGGGRQGKGDYRAQATMTYGNGGGQYNSKGYKGGKGNYSKGKQPWNSQRQAPPHIECWNCGKNHFAFQCKEPPDTRDPRLQQRVNAVDSTLNSNLSSALNNSGECKHEDIVQQFESTEQATTWINAVRQATVDQLVMMQQQHQPQEITDSFNGHWQATQGPYWPDNSWPGNSTQINAVDQGDHPHHHQETHSQESLQDKDGNTMNGSTTEAGKEEEAIEVDPPTNPDCINAAPPTAPAKQQSPHFLRTTFTDSDPVEIESKWDRVFTARIKKWKNRRRRRGAERKAKERSGKAARLIKEKEEEEESIQRRIAAVTEAALAWKVVNRRPEFGPRKLTKSQPTVCNVPAQHDHTGNHARRIYRPRIIRPSAAETVHYMTLLLIAVALGTAFTVSVSADSSILRSALTTAAHAAITMTMSHGMSMKHGAVAAPILGILWYCIQFGSFEGYNIDILISGASYSAAHTSANAALIVAQSGASMAQSITQGNLFYLSCASQPQMAHMLALLLFVTAALWTLTRPPDRMNTNHDDPKEIARISAIKEKAFNAAYVEIELVDEPGRIIKVLLDLGASCSVFSKRSLAGIYHKLVRYPPAASLIAANGGSLGLAEGIARLRFRFKGYEQVFEHNVEIIDNDGVPSIFGIDFWKTIGADVSLSNQDRGDTVSFMSNGTKVTLPVYCSAPNSQLQVDTRLTSSICMQPEGHRGDKLTVKAYLDCDPSEVRQNQKLLWTPSIVMCENNNSIYDDNSLDLKPTRTSHTSYVTNPQIERNERGELVAYVAVVLSNQEDVDLVVRAGATVGTVQAYDTHNGDVIASVSKQQYEEDMLSQPAHRVWTHLFQMQPTGIWRPCAILGVNAGGAHELLFRRGAEVKTVTASKAAISCALIKYDPLLANRTELNGHLYDEERTKGDGREQATQFKPETSLPKQDWRQKLNHDPDKLFQHMWEHHTKEEYDLFIKEFNSRMKFGEVLTKEQKEKTRKLIFIYRKIISLDQKTPKPIKGVECRLHFRTSRPTPHVQGLRRLSPADKDIHEEMTHKMLTNNIIEYADSEWAAGVVLAKKKGTTEKRYAVDLRGVNLELLGAFMGVPRIDELLDEWGKASWFSTWDNSQAFWTIPVRQEDRRYLAYYAWYQGRYQQFQFKVMPYGLRTASSIYQTTYSKVMRGLKGCTVYIDDAVQATVDSSYDHHLKELAAAFVRLEANNMYVKLPKCLWGTKVLPVLGHMIKANEGTFADPQKCEAIMDMAQPSTVGVLKSLLGAAGYLSKYVPDYAALVEPLREMDCNGRSAQYDISHEWTVRRTRAFEGLKAALCSSPVLAPPDFDKQWIVLTDCSGTTMGAVLAQKDANGVERPVAYASCTLSEAQRNYSISELEGLAVVWACKKWRHFLHGSKYGAIVATDHSCLKNLTSSKLFENRRLNRYAVELSEYNLKIIFRPGKTHHLPDLLSRMKRVKPGSVEAKRIGDEAHGHTAGLLLGSECNIGTKQARYADSDVFSADAAQRRLQQAVAAIEQQEGSTIEAMFKEMEEECKIPSNNARSGDEHDTTLWEFYNMIASAAHDQGEPFSLHSIKSAQQQDRFSAQMSAHLQSGRSTIPADEMEARQVLIEAPFYMMQDDMLYRLEKPKSFKTDKMTRVELTGELQKLLYIPQGMRGRVLRLVHEELGHAGETRSYQALRARFYWPAMYANTTKYIQHCGTCQLHAKRAPKAPIQGHLRASRAGEAIAMDVLHLAKGEKDEGYLLCVIDVFSRYAITVPIPNTKSLTVATALRDDVLKHGWGRPTRFILDGASYFKAEVEAGITAWNSIMRVSAPHHSESHGAIEKFNQTYARTLKTFGKPADWRDNYSAANEAYNRSVHRLLSAAGMPLSPIEVWRPGQTVSAYRIPETTTKDSVPKDYREHYEEQVRLHQQINKCVEYATKKYQKQMVDQPLNVHRQKQLRTFKLSETVTRFKDTGNKTIDKLSALQEGPYTIVKVEDTGVDYIIQRQGSTEPPVRVHVDEIKAYRTFQPIALANPDSDYEDSDEEDAVSAAKPHSKRYSVRRIMAERKLSPRQGGQKQYLVDWEPDGDKEFSCSWQPAENLECPAAIQSWTQQSLSERSTLMKEAKKIGINSVTAGMGFQKALSDVSTLLLMDLSRSRRSRMVLDVCKRMNVDPKDVLLVWASPPCDTYSKLGPVNEGRGSHTRDFSDPTWPPRGDGSEQARRAEAADELTENLGYSLMAAKKDHGIEFAQENPTGGMARRPFMQSPEWLECTQCMTIDYCAYGHAAKKPTNIWVSEFGWEPKGTTGDGKCHQLCDAGAINKSTGGYQHKAVLAGRGDRPIATADIRKHKYAVPKHLLQEIVLAASTAGREHRKIIIDLFAGYGSMKEVAEELGLTYIAVDVKDFM